MLDGLRGVAILLVLAAHVGMPGKGGPVGVTLFFVLSGFLITNLLLMEEARTGSVDLVGFYQRRAIRLFPALGVYLAGTSLLALSQGMTLDWIWSQTWAPLVYLANYAQISGVEMQMHWHTWSLAVEEHFYLAWPIVLVAIPAARRFGRVLVGVLVLAAWSVVATSFMTTWSYAATDTNAYALGAGCLVAIARANGWRPKMPEYAPALGVFLLVALTTVSQPVVRQPLVVGVSAFTVLACVGGLEGLLTDRRLRSLGRISYALYLWHVPILMMAGSLETRLVAGAASILIAWVSWVLIERPLLARRDKWVKRTTVRAAVATGRG